MISLVEQDSDRQRLLRLCEKTAFGCKIAAVARAYGFDKGFACFWLDDRSDTVFCQTDDVMILSGTVLDREQTAAFLHAVGPRAVICAVRNAEALALPVTASGDVLKKHMDEGAPLASDPYAVNIRDVFTLLESAGMADEFEPFYLDLSHKLRHDAALVQTEYRGSDLAGCAVVSSVSSKAAVLSALVVREDLRRQGIGSGLIHRVEACFPGKNLYVFRDKDKNRAFYKSLKYVKTDTWVYSIL